MLPILNKTEQACANVATSASISLGYTPETNIYIRRGMDNEDIKAPAVICYAESATEDFVSSGIYRVATHITVKEMAGDISASSFISSSTPGNIGNLAGNIFSYFLVSNIEQKLSASVSNYYVHQARVENYSDSTTGDALAATYQFEIVCALSPV